MRDFSLSKGIFQQIMRSFWWFGCYSMRPQNLSFKKSLQQWNHQSLASSTMIFSKMSWEAGKVTWLLFALVELNWWSQCTSWWTSVGMGLCAFQEFVLSKSVMRWLVLLTVSISFMIISDLSFVNARKYLTEECTAQLLKILSSTDVLVGYRVV